jgi:hypothetical protein
MNTSVKLPGTTSAQRKDAATQAIDEYKAQIAWAADTLIPADAQLGMPSATQAGLIDLFLPKALAARDDMLPAFIDAVRGLPAATPEDPMRTLRALPDGGFDVIARVVAGAYFWSAEINQKLKYPGQQEIRETPDYDFLMERIAPVMERGEIYVKV